MFQVIALAVGLSFLSPSFAGVSLQNELSEALQNCIATDLAEESSAGPNVANHGDPRKELAEQKTKDVRPVFQTGCEGEAAKKLLEAASKLLKYEDYPYPGCKQAGCKSVTRDFQVDGKNKPGYAFCVTNPERNHVACVFGATYPVKFK